MAYGDSLGLTLPVSGVTTFANAAVLVDTAFQAIIAVVEQKVRPASIDINADLSYKSGSSYFKAKDLKASQYQPQTLASLPAASHPAAVFFNSTDGELYVNDNGGRQIKMTNLGSVNAAAGNVTGAGYGSGGVEINWDAGNTAYRMRKGAGTHDFANVVLNKLRMNDGDSHELTLQPPNLTGNKTITLPDLPSSGESLLKLTSAGVLSASDSITPSSGTQTVTGALTATGNVTAAGYRYSTDDVYTLPACMGHSPGGILLSVSNNAWIFSSGSDLALFPFYLPVGTRILSYSAYGKVISGTSEFSVKMFKRVASSDTVTQIGTTQTTGPTVNGTYYNPGQSLGTPETVAANTEYWIEVLQTSAGTIHITAADFTCDRP
jgi:hypothetical protein